MKRQRVVVTVLVAVVAFLSGGWLLQRDTQGDAGVYQKARLFDDVLTYVAEYYVDSLPEPKLYDMAIDGMLGALKDPYTTYLRPSDYKDLELATTGNYGGVGMQIDVRDGWITVVAPIAGTPAEQAGIQSGDRIVQIDGHTTRGFNNDKAVQELRGPAGTHVKLTVARPGLADTVHFDITRAHIHVTSVQYAGLLGGGDVGYVSLANSAISESTADELAGAVDSLRQRGAKALILDLRGNPGGVLDQGVAVSDLFLNPGDVVVETKGRAPGSTDTYRADHAERWPGMPVVVLVDQYTASAAEIIAGALQDHDRALLLGTPTFGKGLVQTVYPLNGRDFLKMTTGRWYTPSGRSIQRPMHDIMLEETGEALVDTAQVVKDSAQVYHTSGVRVVRGGGGIRPDIISRADTLTDGEKALSRALGSKVTEWRDVLTNYALALKAQDAVKQRGFAVTPAMRAELLRRLLSRGVTIPDSVWSGAQQLIDEQIAYSVTGYVFGRPAEFARRLSDDAEVKEAVGLLQRAHSPKELLSLSQAQPTGRR